MRLVSHALFQLWFWMITTGAHRCTQCSSFWHSCSSCFWFWQCLDDCAFIAWRSGSTIWWLPKIGQNSIQLKQPCLNMACGTRRRAQPCRTANFRWRRPLSNSASPCDMCSNTWRMCTRRRINKQSGDLMNGGPWPRVASWWKSEIASSKLIPWLLGMLCRFVIIQKIPIFTKWRGCWPMVHGLWASTNVVHVMGCQTAALWMRSKQSPTVQRPRGSSRGSGAITSAPWPRQGLKKRLSYEDIWIIWRIVYEWFITHMTYIYIYTYIYTYTHIYI